LAVLDHLTHHFGHGVPFKVDVAGIERLGDHGNGPEVAEQFEVVVGPQELRLSLVHLHRGGFQLGQRQQGVGPGDADVVAAVQGVQHHVHFRVVEVVQFLPALLVLVGGVATGVGVVRSNLSKHHRGNPLPVGHGPSDGVVRADEGGRHLFFILVVVAGEVFVDGVNLKPVLVA